MRTPWYYRFLPYRVRARLYAHRVGCCEGRFCRGLMPRISHYVCWNCGRKTCTKTVRVDPTSLRRRYVGQCRDCTFVPDAKDVKTRRRRTDNDWSRPIPDQYPGLTRSTIAEFLGSDEREIVLPDADLSLIATYNQSVERLGYGDECYAEQRANTVVLRRVG